MKKRFILFLTLCSVILTGCFEKEPIDVLDKAVGNLAETKSIELDAKIELEMEQDGANVALELPFNVYINNTKEDKNISKLNVEKNDLFGKIDAYFDIEKDVLKTYIGNAEAEETTWVLYENKIKESESELKDIDVKEVITSENFALLDEENGIKHYLLIVNNDLLKRLENELDIESEKLTKEIEIDIYINKASKITKIEADLTPMISSFSEAMKDFTDGIDLKEIIKEFSVTIDFKNYNDTYVTIPDYVIDNAIPMDGVIEDANMAAAESNAKGFADAARLHWIENEFEKTQDSSVKSLTSANVNEIDVQGNSPTGCTKVTYDENGKVNFQGCIFNGYKFNCVNGDVRLAD